MNIHDFVKDLKLTRVFTQKQCTVIENLYITSITTLFVQNVWIPIVFTFSLEEDIPIYTDFFKDFQNTFGFPISDFIDVVESDQGGALKSAVEQFGLRHLCCLRHLLVSLGHEEYSYQIGKLISVCTYDEFRELKEIYEESWSQITDEAQLQQLIKLLLKVGLGMNKKVEIVDVHRWHEVSKQFRHIYHMPSCTNQIETSHGHFNSNTPGRNDIWHSIKRLIVQILKRNLLFGKKFHHNYLRYQKKIKNIVKNTPQDVMKAMAKHYKTSGTEKNL